MLELRVAPDARAVGLRESIAHELGLVPEECLLLPCHPYPARPGASSVRVCLPPPL
ncbi:hypothetical protein T484DRAFT_1922750 [Baffinella frigidus]|nr:hypothetical protein T484DRAFT_1922750 [Cryptophyta sp. CCMP2293]